MVRKLIGGVYTDELRALRRKKVEQRRPQQVREFLHTLYTGYLANELDPQPNSIVVILIGDDGPSVHWGGAPSTPDLRKASWALQEAIREYRPWPSPEDLEEIQQREAEYSKRYPFACDYEDCRRRFATQRGLNTHKRACYFRPDKDK